MEGEILEEKSSKISNSRLKTRKASIAFTAIFEDTGIQEPESSSRNIEAIHDDDDAHPELVQEPFFSGRNSIFSIFSGISARSFSHNNTYSFVISFIIILLFGFVVGAITYKLFFCALIQL